jgi:glycosyltransferase involved in cell wall biosynthesis
VKIAFVIEGIYEYAIGAPEAVGGLERDQWLLARALVAAGWSATVAVRGSLKNGERKTIDGVDYVGLGPGQVLLAWRQFLSRERPNWLFWESASHLWGPLVEIANLSGARTIFHLAFDSDVQPRKALNWRRRWWPLYAWGLLRTDKIFVQHMGQLCNLPPRLRSKAYVLPKVCLFSGRLVDPVSLRPHSARTKYVAWVGMLRQPKRPDLLVEIARRLPHVRFVVCGGPSTHRSSPGYGERIIESLRCLPNVDFHGKVPPQTAAQVIADAALLLSTADREGFPNTFTQAWSAGTPVVSLKVDPDHLIARKGLGKFSGSLDAATADIHALMNSPQCREEIGTRARSYIVDHHSETAVTKIFIDAIHDARRSYAAAEDFLSSTAKVE